MNGENDSHGCSILANHFFRAQPRLPRDITTREQL